MCIKKNFIILITIIFTAMSLFSVTQNIAKLKPVKASVSTDASYVNDGNNLTVLSLPGNTGSDQWVYIDLGKSRMVESIELKWYNDLYAADYQMAGTNSLSEQWTFFNRTDNNTSQHNKIDCLKTFRYVGILMTRSNNTLYGLREFIVNADAPVSKYWKFHTGGNNSDTIVDFHANSDGSIIAVGTTNSSNIPELPGNGGPDIYIVKLSSEHEIVWQKRIGTSQRDDNCKIIQLQSGMYLISYSEYPDTKHFILLDDNGVIQGTKTHTFDAKSFSLIPGHDSGFLQAYRYNSSRLSSLVKFDNQGEILWKHEYNNNGYPALASAKTGDGYFFGCKYSIIKYNNNGTEIFSTAVNDTNTSETVNKIAALADGGLVFTTSRTNGRIDGSGNILWQHNQRGGGIKVHNNSIYFYGTREVNVMPGDYWGIEHYLARYSLDGTYINQYKYRESGTFLPRVQTYYQIVAPSADGKLVYLHDRYFETGHPVGATKYRELVYNIHNSDLSTQSSYRYRTIDFPRINIVKADATGAIIAAGSLNSKFFLIRVY